jgi:hypothetical protein
MMKTLRSILFFLLLLGMMAAFLLESRLRLSTGGHELLQIVIASVICWLAWRWVMFDETHKWRISAKLEPAQVHSRLVSTLKAHLSLARVVHALLSVGVVFALTLVMRLIGSKTVGEGVIAILYLLPIGWCTVRWGQIAGVSAALTAALSFDFLFIPPYNTFNIGSLEGWLLLILFSATAILVVGRIQVVLTEERERERKATFLYEMVAAIANQTTREGIARVIANQIQQKFLAKSVQVHLSGGWGYQNYTMRADDGQTSTLDEKPDRALTIVSGPEVIGEIDIWQGKIALPFREDPMLQTMLSQITAALDWVQFAEGKSPYPKQKPSYSEGNSLQESHS